MKTEKRQEARILRETQGLSLKEISNRLGVAKSSVSLWVRDIPIVANKKKYCEISRLTRLSHEKDKRLAIQDSGRLLAKSLKNEKDFIAGCMMYWAEGAKDRYSVSITNTDSEVLKLFIRFLKRYFKVDDDRFSVFCRYYTDISKIGEPERYWVKELNLPEKCVKKSCVNYYPKEETMVKKRYSHGKLRFGTCRVKINSVEIKQMIYGAIQELMGFNKPEWNL